MKRAILLFTIAFIAMACNKTETPVVETPEVLDPVLTITSDTDVTIDSTGGEGIITYTLDNARNELKLTAVSNVNWIEINEVNDTIKYTVDSSYLDSERHGTIELSYGEKVAYVSVTQRAAFDLLYEAVTTAGSTYFGGDTLYNYYVILSVAGMSDSGYLYANSEYYYFDLYSNTASNGNRAIIPNGTYRLTTDSVLSDGVIDSSYSNLTITTDDDYYEISYLDAELIVSNNSIVATVTLDNGKRHRIEYHGSLEIASDQTDTPNSNLSTLTDDHLFDIEDGVFVGAFVGDYLNNGCNTCQVYMFEYLDYETGEERGDQFQIDLQLPYGTTDICGTYTAGATEGHFIPGSAEDLGGQLMQQNSWYMTAGYINFAPLVDGTVIVEMEGEDLYKFTIDTVDDKGNAIKGVFKGHGQFTEW